MRVVPIVPFLPVLLCLLSIAGFAGFAVTLQQAHASDKRSNVIDFDDETIEGLNKRPLDSLSQLSEKDKRKRKPHLYRKRGGFRTETAETLRTLKFTQSQ